MIFDSTQPPCIRGPHQGTLKSCKSSVKVMTAQIFLVFETWRFLWFFFFKKLRYKKLIELKFLNPSVGCFRGNFESYKSGVQLWLLKSLWFSRYGFFHDFFFFFFQKIRYKKKLTELKFFNPLVGCYRDTFKGYKSSVQVWLLKSLWFSRYGVFYDFSFFL